MGCGSGKTAEASGASGGPGRAPPKKPPVPADDPEGQWEDPKSMMDPFLDREINGKKFGKDGVAKDPYDRDENRPEENEGFGMFQMEAAGQGDQALAVKPWVG